MDVFGDVSGVYCSIPIQNHGHGVARLGPQKPHALSVPDVLWTAGDATRALIPAGEGARLNFRLNGVRDEIYAEVFYTDISGEQQASTRFYQLRETSGNGDARYPVRGTAMYRPSADDPIASVGHPSVAAQQPNRGHRDSQKLDGQSAHKARPGRKIILTGAAVLVVFLLSAASLSSRGNAATAPKLSCSVKSIAISGKNLVAAGSCEHGTTIVPAKNVKWTWGYHSADIDGLACGSFGNSSGTGTTAALPEAPRCIGSPCTGHTRQVLVHLHGAANYKGKTARATKAFSKTTSSSRVICGNPPKMTTAPLAVGAQPACTWGSSPTYSGGLLKAGASIKCAGLSNCQWHSAQVYMQAGYLVAGSTFTCNGGYVGFLGFEVAYYNSPNHGAMVECSVVASRARMYPVPTTWGPNYLFLLVAIDLTQGGQTVRPTGASWQLLTKNSAGTVDPCPIGH